MMTQKNNSQSPANAEGKKPRLLHPYVVMLIALVLPGVGQVLNNMAARGVSMLFFIIILGWATYHTTTPEHSVLGRFAGGLLVYALSLLDAYRWARHRWEYFKKYPD